MFEIRYTDGRTEQYEDYQDAVAEILADNFGAYIEEFEDRTLVWDSEEDSIDDDGAKAIASIWEVA